MRNWIWRAPVCLAWGILLTMLPAMADTLIVDTLVDESDGDFGPGDFSLREAVAQAVADDVIEFAPSLFAGGAGTIHLGSRITVSSGAPRVINGPGTHLLRLDAGGVAGIFQVDGGGDLSISGMTLQNGGGSTGSLIVASGDLSVVDCVLRNSSTDGPGGAIQGTGTTNRVEVRRSTISETQSDQSGGGIYMNGGTLVLDGVLIFGCEAGAFGGGLALNAGVLYASNCTVSTNQSKSGGAGVRASGGLAHIVHCTVVENLGGRDGAVGGRAGGIANDGGTVVLENTLVAGNSGTPLASGLTDSSPDLTGAFTADAHNLVGVAGSATGLGSGDIVLETDEPFFGSVDVYQELGNRGGTTRSHDLVPGSPAINAGDDTLAIAPETGTPLTTDQRGAGYPRKVGGSVDIGAIDTQPNLEDLGIAVTQAPLQLDPTNSLPILLNITLSEPSLGFDVFDIAFTGTAVVSSASLNRTGTRTYALSVDAVDNDGTLTVNIPAGSAVDRFGREFQAAEGDRSVTYDTRGPAVLLSSSAPDPVNGSFDVTAAFDEPAYSFDAQAIQVTNGSGIVGDGGPGSSTIVLTVTPSGDGPVSVSVAAGLARDLAGNDSTASVVPVVRTYDGTRPAAALASIEPDPTNALSFLVAVTFDEPVSGFSIGGLTLDNCSARLTGGSDDGVLYSLEITPSQEGLVAVTVNADAATDPAGNGNIGSNTLTRTHDVTGPIPAVGTTADDPTDQQPVPFFVTFGEPVTGFNPDDLIVTNGTVTNFTGSGANYEFEVIVGADGRVTVDVAPDAAVDAAGNLSAAAVPRTVVFDTARPEVSSLTREGVAVTNAPEVDFRVNFSEAVTGVDSTDFSIAAAGRAVTGASVGAVFGIDAEYVITVNTGEGQGLLGITVLADGTIADLAGRAMISAFSGGETYEIDHVAPTVVIASTAPDPTIDADIPVSVSFSEAVNGFEFASILVSGGSAHNLTGSGASYTFEVLAEAGGGVVTVGVAADAASDSAGNACQASNLLTRRYVDLNACNDAVHTADQDMSGAVNLAELLRIIQFFNSSAFHCQLDTEDGYAPGPGDIGTCCPHASDYIPRNGSISLTELLRVIQFFNSGGYHYCPSAGTEDGFCPGTAQ